MSELPQQWPGHTFTRAETETVLDRLRKDQDPKGAPFIGERLALAPPDSPRQHAAQFGISCFRSDPEAELRIVRLLGRYQTWCLENGHAQLPPDDIACELRNLFEKAGLPIEGPGNDVVVRGLALAE